MTDMSAPKRQARIRRLGRWMARICLVTSLLLVTSMLAYWVLTPSADLYDAAGLPHERGGTIGVSIRLFGFTLAMLPLAVLAYGLENARRCFAGFADGRFFSLQADARLRRFAIAAGMSALLQPIAETALSLLLSINGLPGSRTLRLEIGSETLIMIVFAGTVAVIAWLMAEAAMMAEEHEQFV